MPVRARKRFGQHFLRDEAALEACVRAIDPQPTDRMVEIGPGRGALTAVLLAGVERLTAVELDRDLARALRARWPEARLQLVQADALAVDFTQFAAPDAPGASLRIVGNLPYNISTPLLFHLMGGAACVRDQHVMLQREVVERMVAAPGTSAYGRLSVMLQARYHMTHLFDVAPEAFDPPPRVVSAFVRMRPLSEAAWLRARDPALFAGVVQRAFEQRRKMLRVSLGPWAALLDWDALGLSPTDRPQALSVAQFVALADALADAGVAV